MYFWKKRASTQERTRVNKLQEFAHNMFELGLMLLLGLILLYSALAVFGLTISGCVFGCD